MAEHTYEELKHKTIADLREIARGLDHEAVQGYSQLNKEHLLPGLCEALGIDTHEHHHHVIGGFDKGAAKRTLRVLKAEKQSAFEAGDRAQVKALRRRIHRINHQIRAHVR
jgi:DNA-binding IclR family transcriptional regulator